MNVPFKHAIFVFLMLLSAL